MGFCNGDFISYQESLFRLRNRDLVTVYCALDALSTNLEESDSRHTLQPLEQPLRRSLRGRRAPLSSPCSFSDAT